MNKQSIWIPTSTGQNTEFKLNFVIHFLIPRRRGLKNVYFYTLKNHIITKRIIQTLRTYMSSNEHYMCHDQNSDNGRMIILKI